MQQALPSAPPASSKTSPASAPKTLPRATESGADEQPKPKPKFNYYDFKAKREQMAPRLAGMKEKPRGATNCLGGLKFLLTGVLESLQREEAEELIKDHGGTVQKSVSKAVDYVVVGDEPGPSKIAKATELGLKTLDEDGLFELIRARPEQKFTATPAKPVSKQGSFFPHPTSSGISGAHAGMMDVMHSVGKSTGATSKPVQERYSAASVAEASAPPLQRTTSSQGPQQDVDPLSSLWTTKYAPQSSKKIIGQSGDRSNAVKLKEWLDNWHAHLSHKPKTLPAKTMDGREFQAILMVGPPGVGKTTTATVVCRECGYEPIELNASDARSKNLLEETIGNLTRNKTMTQFYAGDHGTPKTERVALIFDEVDGMAGNEDRGGVAEIIKLISRTKIPIICIANEVPRKLMSLKAKCYNLSFSRPKTQQIVGNMLSVAHREGIKINPIMMGQIVDAANGDVRQVLNNLYLFSRRTSDLTALGDQVKDEAKAAFKDMTQTPFGVIGDFFKPVERGSMEELTQAYFVDYSLMPLFVQENYLKHAGVGVSAAEHLCRMADAADAISESDLLATHMQENQSYKALPMLAALSCVRPGFLARGRPDSSFRPPYGGFGLYTFPSWLSKYSVGRKFRRYTAELQQHMRMAMSADRRDVRLAYVPFLRQRLNQPLQQQGQEGIDEVLQMMEAYSLTRADFDAIVELDQLQGTKASAIDSKVKRTFTLRHKKEAKALPFDTNELPSKKRSRKGSLPPEFEGGEEGEATLDTFEEEDPDAEENEEDESPPEELPKPKKRNTPRVASGSGKAGAAGRAKPAAKRAKSF